MRKRFFLIQSPRCLCFLLVVLLGNCQQSLTWLEEPNLLKDKGIALGDDQASVADRMGRPHSELNFRTHGYPVSICEYDSQQLYYMAGYERDDVGILPPQTGIHARQRRDYRFVFINRRLYSIEDFIRRRYSALAEEDAEIKDLLDNVRKNQ